jgi:hypothetical protein
VPPSLMVKELLIVPSSHTFKLWVAVCITQAWLRCVSDWFKDGVVAGFTANGEISTAVKAKPVNRLIMIFLNIEI